LAESFDEWVKPKVENGYHRFLRIMPKKDIVNLVQATKSSLYCDVELWKQVPDQWGEAGVKRAKWLQKIS
jgi:beta-galactosidase